MKNDTELMIIPFRCSETEYTLLIVMQDGNIERLKSYDPAEVPMDQMPTELTEGLKLRNVVLAYATREEVQKIVTDTQLGMPLTGILKMLSRGWKYRPECGDDKESIIIRKAGRG